jgi:nicotinamide mononucleotide (NMN) deamidase PncC
MELTDAVVEAVAAKVAEQVKMRMDVQWGAAVSEMANTREATEKLTGQLMALERKVEEQANRVNQVVQRAENTILLVQENQVKARAALTYALKDLGLTE